MAARKKAGRKKAKGKTKATRMLLVLIAMIWATASAGAELEDIASGEAEVGWVGEEKPAAPIDFFDFWITIGGKYSTGLTIRESQVPDSSAGLLNTEAGISSDHSIRSLRLRSLGYVEIDTDFQNPDLSYQRVSATSGPLATLGKWHELYVAATFDATFYGYAPYSYYFGGYTTLTPLYDSYFQHLSFQFVQEEFAGPLDSDDAFWIDISLGLGKVGMLGESDWLTVTPRWIGYRANQDLNRYTEIELSLEYGVALTYRLTGYLLASGSRRTYSDAYFEGGYEPPYEDESYFYWFQQKDWLIYGTASLTYPIEVALGLSIELRYEYEGLRSNDPLQNYNSHNLGLFLHWWPGRGSLQHLERLGIYGDSMM